MQNPPMKANAVPNKQMQWQKVLELDELGEGRVTTVNVGTRRVAMTKFEGQYGALDNRCPHQGGPLGEGSIENGLLRCPWHGWDYHPCTGKAPGYDDGVETFAVEEREDGIYVGMEVEEERTRTISDVMAETFTAWGIDTVFGMVGHSNLGVADALREQEKAGKLRYIGVRHEGAASFACSGYAKLSGRPAACLAIAGPGSTNLLTGLWDAKVDRAPVLALCGQVQTQVLGPGAFQEIDLEDAFKAVVTWSATVLPDSKPAELASLALKHAITERGVAQLIFPDDVQVLPATEDQTAATPAGRMPTFRIAPDPQVLEDALKLLRGSQRPVFIVGHGARSDMPAIIRLAETLHAPVLTTFKAKGQIADDHPLGCGVLGRSGTPIASWFMNEADLLVVFGASFSNHTGITSKLPTIQIDYDALALGRFHAIDVPLWAEISLACVALQDALTGGTKSVDRHAEIAERWALWRAEKERRRCDDRGEGLSSAFIFEELSKAVAEDAVIAVDVGNNTYSFGRYFECKRQSVLMSGYLGSIGFALPAAMGAWCAAPDRQIVSVSGDGGFGQYMGEITTAVHYSINLTHVLLNNGQLGKITKEQKGAELAVWQTSLTNPNFAEYATNCGALGIRVTTRSELPGALARSLAHDGPALVEILADADLI